VLLVVAVPVIYALAWVIASAARRTPASLMLTGREAVTLKAVTPKAVTLKGVRQKRSADKAG
jgi:hypothetical protein